MSIIDLIVGGLVTWRATLMLMRDTGPLDVFSRIRAFLAKKQKRAGGLFDLVTCPSCLSIYIGSVVSLGLAGGVFEWGLYTFTFSAITLLIGHYIAK